MPKKIEKKIKHNPVAKYARKYNKAAIHKDRTKYSRKPKHQSDKATSEE
jgi:hypothetical protein